MPSSPSIGDALAGRVFTSGRAARDHDRPRLHRRCLTAARRLGYGPWLLVPLGRRRQPCAGCWRWPSARAGCRSAAPTCACWRRSPVRRRSRWSWPRAARDAERLGLLEDRDRIAKDLHDVVIQRLFAIAMTLMSAVRLVERPEASDRVQHAVDELDETIRQIRSTIFALQSPARTAEPEPARADRGPGRGRPRPSGLHARPADGGPAGQPRCPTRIAEQLLAVLREALSNVVRHAKAAKAERGGGGRRRASSSLIVQDNGVGLPAERQAQRAAQPPGAGRAAGRFFEVGCPPEGGTRLVWSVPLGEDES